MWLPSALLSPSSKSKKTKQTLKNFLIFSQKSISDISGKGTFLYFLKKKKKKKKKKLPEIELSSLKNKQFQEVTFQARKIKKIYSEKTYILGNVIAPSSKTYYISGGSFKAPKPKFLILLQKELQISFPKKDFKIIISIFSIKLINQYYWFLKTLKAYFYFEFF